MYVLERQKQINMPSIWDERQWDDVINGDTGNSLLLSYIFLIRYFIFLQGFMFTSPRFGFSLYFSSENAMSVM